MRFADFELDDARSRLLRSGVRVALTPKALAVLGLLAERAPRLVTKDELLDTVWGHQHLSESVLKSVISELRSALVDDAHQPRFVETVARRGYRFIGCEPAPAHTPAAPPPAPGPATLVGREAELAALRRGWQLAGSGQRQIVWIAGEPGVGKTTLVDQWVADLGDRAHVARGQCVEQFGVGEPYLPVLEALGGLCAVQPGLVGTLRAVAPTWLVQMPWLIRDDERESLRRELAGVGQERMVREFGELLERYPGPAPLLLVTEDLHWSDPSTLLLINHVARRRAPARLMWLSTFRVAEVVATDHPLQSLRRELKLHRQCQEIALEPFTERELATYLEHRFGGAAPDEAVVRRLHRHTDGLPLFVVNVVEHLTGGDAGAAPIGRLDAAPDALPVPESLFALVERRIESLPAADRAVLQAASVCGVGFDAAVVAKAAEVGDAEVVEALDRLTRGHAWLRVVRQESEAAAEAASPRYAFGHALYRHVFYRLCSAGLRHQLHLRAGAYLAGVVGAAAAEVAVHFERGGDAVRAARFGAAAATNALRHFAPLEAMELSAHALSLLAGRAGAARSDDAEIAVLEPRAVAAAQLYGLTSPEIRHAFVRMQWLSRRGGRPAGAAAELGLGWMYNLRGQYGRALALAQRVEAQARASGDALSHAGACNLLGGTLALKGELVAAADWLETGLRDFEPVADAAGGVPFIVDLGVSLHARLGHVSTNLGRISSAAAHLEAATRRAEAVRQPYARALVAVFAGIHAIRLDRPERALALAERLESAMEGRALADGLGPLRWLRGWAVAKLGDPQSGCALIAEGRRLQDALGRIGGGSNAALAPCVEALVLAGRLADAAAELESALAVTRRLGEGLHLLDLVMQQGKLAELQGDREAAHRHLAAAWSLARSQGASWLEVQALVELLRGVPSSRPYREALADASRRLVGADGTLLMTQVRALLGETAQARAAGAPH